MYYDGKWIKHQYEPLINKELFERVQSILTQNGTHNRNNVDENAGKQWPEITINHLDEFDKVVV